MENGTKQTELSALLPHPKNPRIVERSEVISQISDQIKARGSFDPAHAILVRPVGDKFEIISGHHRVTAARRAGLTAVPCWVRDMSDDDAFMALVLSNAQSELSALERGMHALQATEKGSKTGRSVAAYAEMVGRAPKTVSQETWAAEVANAVCSCAQTAMSDLDTYPRHLAEIHAAPEAAWPALVQHLLKEGWTVKQTQAAVAQVKEITIPEHWRTGFLPDEKVISAVLACEMGQNDVTFLAAEADRILKDINKAAGTKIGGFDDLNLDTKPHELAMIKWLVANAAGKSWSPSDLKVTGKSLLDKIAAKKMELEATAKARKSAAEDEKRRVKEAEDAEKKRAADAKRAEEQARKTVTEKLLDEVSLSAWGGLDDAMKKVILTPGPSSDKFNVQNSGEDENSIDWAQYTWNPITGCLHECPYCYARDIATRFTGTTAFPNGFTPTLRANRLNAPGNTKVSASDDPRAHRVFVGSMTDLFGRWVPSEWIERVLDIAANTPDWEFLMLTKFPKRMSEFEIPENVWMGTSVDCQARVSNAEKAFEKVKAKVKWLSVEPLIEPLKFSRLDLFDMLAIGGASKSSNTPRWIPPYHWIEDLMRQANAAKCSVYLKSNIYLKESPGDARYIVADKAPPAFNYLRKNGEV